jgi:calcineurin-like phosphoesterase family protein
VATTALHFDRSSRAGFGMKKLFFTSDTHFGHHFALTKRKRPFATLEEMDEFLIARWNETVGVEDEVHHLGDVAHLEHARLAEVLARLNGRLHLILCNNDSRAAMAATGRWDSIAEMRELTLGEQRIFLCHYPLREWPNAWRGAWHLFGHVHGKFDKNPHGMSLDVGVDSHGFSPLPFEAIVKHFTRDAAAAAE